MIKFGTDGWRAIIAKEFTFENVGVVAQAIADFLEKTNKKKNKRVVIGYDRRFLSKDFAQTVALVLAANKIKVVLSTKDVPTPVVSFHCRYNNYDLGVMITASHNPAEFNGLKIKTKEGGAADKELTNQVEELFYKTKVKSIDKEIAESKKLLGYQDLTSDYLKFLKNFVDLKEIRKLKLSILVDTMYGVGSRYIEDVLGKQDNIKIDYLHDVYNPSFGGIHPEPVEENLQELISVMKKGKYDLGVVLDGDADRIALVDGKGNFINAQVILPLLAIHMVKNRKEAGGIGKTVVGSNLIDAVTVDLGVPCYETPVGFKYISDLFKENLICIGGEEAGGIGFNGYIPERDGSVATLILLEMLAWQKKNFNQLLAELYLKYGRWYYKRSKIALKSVKKGLEHLKLPEVLLGEKVERVNRLDGIKLITSKFWLMFRASGTEPIVRVYAEAKSKALADKLVALGEKMVYAL